MGGLPNEPIPDFHVRQIEGSQCGVVERPGHHFGDDLVSVCNECSVRMFACSPAVKMMLGMIFVFALAGAAFADDCCSAEDRRELAHLWDRVWASSFTDRKVAIAGAVFDESVLSMLLCENIN